MNIQFKAGTTFWRNHLDNNILTVRSFSLMAILFILFELLLKRNINRKKLPFILCTRRNIPISCVLGFCYVFFLFQLVLSYFIRSSDANTYPLWNNENFRLFYFVMFICFSIYQNKHWKKWRAGWSWPILYFIYLLEKKELCKNISQIFEFQS